MTLTRKARLRLTAVALAIGGVGAALLPASPAVAFFSPPLFLDVRVLSPVHLVAGGAAVDVPLEVTCTGTPAGVFVLVTQRVGGGVASGSGSATVGCTHARERVTIIARAAPGGRAFRVGPAFAEAEIFGCDSGTCGQEHDGQEVRIRR